MRRLTGWMVLASSAAAGGLWACGSTVTACDDAGKCANLEDAGDASDDLLFVETSVLDAFDETTGDDADDGTDSAKRPRDAASDAKSRDGSESDRDAAPESGPGSENQLVAKGLPFTATRAAQVSGPMATVTDAIISDSSTALTAILDWGDGSLASSGIVSGSSGSFSIAGSHAYDGSGPFTVTMTVTATSGAQAVATFKATVQPLTITGFTIPTMASGPGPIAPGPDGNLWFAENNSNKIGRITPSGTISEFMIPSAGAQVEYVVSGIDGNLWFTELGANKIGRSSTAGSIDEFDLTAGSGPDAIVPGPSGNLWFTEFKTNRIGEMSPSGTIVDEFGVVTSGTGPAISRSVPTQTSGSLSTTATISVA